MNIALDGLYRNRCATLNDGIIASTLRRAFASSNVNNRISYCIIQNVSLVSRDVRTFLFNNLARAGYFQPGEKIGVVLDPIELIQTLQDKVEFAATHSIQTIAKLNPSTLIDFDRLRYTELQSFTCLNIVEFDLININNTKLADLQRINWSSLKTFEYLVFVLDLHSSFWKITDLQLCFNKFKYLNQLKIIGSIKFRKLRHRSKYNLEVVIQKSNGKPSELSIVREYNLHNPDENNFVKRRKIDNWFHVTYIKKVNNEQLCYWFIKLESVYISSAKTRK